MSFNPDHYLSDGLGAFSETWDSDFREYWGLQAGTPPEDLTEEEWAGVKFMYDVSQEFLEAARSLDRGTVDFERIAGFVQDVTGEDPRDVEFFAQCMDVLLSRGIGDRLYRQRQRVFDLLSVLVAVRAERSRSYLMRLARCYLYDMEPEGAVMARAVLDTALEDAVGDKEVQYAGNAKVTHRVDLDDRLKHMKREGLLSHEAWRAAEEIRDNGNRAAHLAPGVACDLMSTLDRLKLVLSELEQLSL